MPGSLSREAMPRSCICEGSSGANEGLRGHLHEKAGESFCIGALGQVAAGQGLEALPASEVLIDALMVRGVLLRARVLGGMQAACPRGAMWPRPRGPWGQDEGHLGSWWCRLRRKAWGQASLASLSCCNSWGSHPAVPHRACYAKGCRTQSTPHEGPGSIPIEGGLRAPKGLRLVGQC